MQMAKGTKDTNPSEKILKQRIVQTLKETFEKYGYNPLDTPILERLDILTSKYAGGEEILKEIFKLTDQGQRELCLRYDLTVPFARYISMNKTLKMPFKRYQIGQVFRDGPIKLGRYREFTQCDIDVVGIKDLYAEAELLQLANDAFSKMNMPIKIEVNSRKILDSIMIESSIPKEKRVSTILTIDKMKKISLQEVEKELLEKGLNSKMIETLFELLKQKETNEQTIKFLETRLTSKEGEEAIQEIKKLYDYLKINNTKTIFSPSLARGLSYYTGTVFEIFMQDSKIKSSIAGGGRFDKMITKFVDNNQDYPAVGISFGIDVIFDAMQKEEQKTVVKAFIIPINTLTECIKLLSKLRSKNINCDINITKKGISKALDYASSYNIPYVIIAGEDEFTQNKYKLKDMNSGEELLLEEKELIEKLKEVN